MNIYRTFENYKGGINNLCVVFDNRGIKGTSLISEKCAYKNYLRNRKKYEH